MEPSGRSTPASGRSGTFFPSEDLNVPRMAHQRSIYRTGPHQSWLQRKTYHLMKIFSHVNASIRMRRSMRCLSPGVYHIPPADRLAWLETLDDAEPYARDTTGDRWK